MNPAKPTTNNWQAAANGVFLMQGGRLVTSRKPLLIAFAFLVFLCGLADRASAQSCSPQDYCCGNVSFRQTCADPQP